MTTDPLHQLPAGRREPRRLLEGHVSTPPASEQDLMGVILEPGEGYDGSLELDDCPWTPRPDADPAVGDLVLVAVTRRRAWVVQWWPYDP